MNVFESAFFHCLTQTIFIGITYGLLTCILISENQGHEKSRSISNLRKISSSAANLDIFFAGLHPEK